MPRPDPACVLLKARGTQTAQKGAGDHELPNLTGLTGLPPLIAWLPCPSRAGARPCFTVISHHSRLVPSVLPSGPSGRRRLEVWGFPCWDSPEVIVCSQVVSMFRWITLTAGYSTANIPSPHVPPAGRSIVRQRVAVVVMGTVQYSSLPLGLLTTRRAGLFHWPARRKPCACITIQSPLISCDVNPSALWFVTTIDASWCPFPGPPVVILFLFSQIQDSYKYNSLSPRHRYPWLSVLSSRIPSTTITRSIPEASARVNFLAPRPTPTILDNGDLQS